MVFNGLSEAPPDQLMYLKFVHYTTAQQVYNKIVQSMHDDHSLKKTVDLTEAMRVDLIRYFNPPAH